MARMNRFMRALTIWIVALALPLQGHAAAAMIACGPMHSPMASAVDHSVPHHDHAAPGHSDQSCCSASAAPSPAMPFVGVMQARAGAIPFFGSSEVTVIPDGLERPPRTSLV
jgi:hypothetical protein